MINGFVCLVLLLAMQTTALAGKCYLGKCRIVCDGKTCKQVCKVVCKKPTK